MGQWCVVVYSACMTEMLEEAIEKVRKLPEAEQDEAAAMLLSVASKNTDVVELDAETRAAIREGREQARQGKFCERQGDGCVLPAPWSEALPSMKVRYTVRARAAERDAIGATARGYRTARAAQAQA